MLSDAVGKDVRVVEAVAVGVATAVVGADGSQSHDEAVIMLLDVEVHVGRVQCPASALCLTVGGGDGGGRLAGRGARLAFRKALESHGGAGIIIDGTRAGDTGQGEILQLQIDMRDLQQVERLRVLATVTFFDADGDANGDQDSTHATGDDDDDDVDVVHNLGDDAVGFCVSCLKRHMFGV